MKPKVLIIEDDPGIIETVKYGFTLLWPEAELISAYLGKTGLEIARNSGVDAIILDLGLPDVAGFEVLREIRLFSSIPVIILTANGREEDIVKAFELKANDYVTKPFRHHELISRVKSHVDNKIAELERLELERKVNLVHHLALIGEMAAGIAHEINNPLTPVLGLTELLMKGELPENIKNDLAIISNASKRTSDVVKRLLTFARQSKPQRMKCNINEVIEIVLQLEAYHLKTNGITVHQELELELPTIMVDASQMQQVLLNLIINADYEMSHYHGGGNLYIRTELVGYTIKISVKDDGPGIPTGNMDKLFTPFFTTKKAGEGTGLGLSVCHRIITEHNGRIYAESELDKGATFIIELPLISPGKEVVEEKQKLVNTCQAEAVVKANILVVDDEPLISQVLNRILTDEGHRVTTAGTAKEALELIHHREFDIILLDIKLPDMSGIEVYQYLAQMSQYHTDKIIFITGDVMGTDTANFFSHNQSHYITKPFNTEQLKTLVKHVLMLKERQVHTLNRHADTNMMIEENKKGDSGRWSPPHTIGYEHFPLQERGEHEKDSAYSGSR